MRYYIKTIYIRLLGGTYEFSHPKYAIEHFTRDIPSLPISHFSRWELMLWQYKV